MGTTFVEIGDHGFWKLDCILRLWLRLLALHLEETAEPGSVARKIRDQWLLASKCDFVGCVPDGLEEAVATEEGTTLVRQAIHSLLGALARAPDRLDKGVLNLLGVEGVEFIRNVETASLVEVGRAFLDLLDGKMATDAADTSFMPGSRPPSDAVP